MNIDNSIARNVVKQINDQIHENQVDRGFANIMHENLMKQIADFEKGLKPDEEIGACLASFGKEIIIHIQNVGYHNPYFIVFYGSDTQGTKMQLVQHVSQINVLFTAIKLTDTGRKANRIGFIQEEK